MPKIFFFKVQYRTTLNLRSQAASINKLEFTVWMPARLGIGCSWSWVLHIFKRLRKFWALWKYFSLESYLWYGNLSFSGLPEWAYMCKGHYNTTSKIPCHRWYLAISVFIKYYLIYYNVMYDNMGHRLWQIKTLS